MAKVKAKGLVVVEGWFEVLNPYGSTQSRPPFFPPLKDFQGSLISQRHSKAQLLV